LPAPSSVYGNFWIIGHGCAARVAGELSAGGVTVEILVRNDRVAESLLKVAETERASLIARATHGRTASPDRPFGGMAEQLIRACSVPVLVVPSYSPTPFVRRKGKGSAFRTILAATGGSDYAGAIMPLAAGVAQACGSLVILLGISSPDGSQRRAAEGEAAAVAHLAALAPTFEVRGIPVERITVGASLVPGILDVVCRRNVDLVARSTPGGARHCGAAVGSVTPPVPQQAGVAVLMTRTCPVPRQAGDRRKQTRARRRWPDRHSGARPRCGRHKASRVLRAGIGADHGRRRPPFKTRGRQVDVDPGMP